MQSDGFRVGPLALEHPGSLLVPERALARREVRVQRGGDQWVGERDPVVAVHESRGAQRVGGTGGVPGVQPREAGAMAERRVAAEDRQGMRELAGAAGQPGELALDVARDLVGPERAESPGGGLVGRDALGRQVAEQRAQQERVAGRDRMAGVRERCVAGGQAFGDKRLDGGRAERPRSQRRLGGRGEQLGEQLRRAGRLARAHGAQHAEWQLVEPAGEVHQPAQRGRVGPMHIVDDQQRRGRARPGCRPATRARGPRHARRHRRAPAQARAGRGHGARAPRHRWSARPSRPGSGADRTAAARCPRSRPARTGRRERPRPSPRARRRSAPIAPSRLDLPIPAGPSTTTTLPAPDLIGFSPRSRASSSTSRSSSTSVTSRTVLPARRSYQAAAKDRGRLHDAPPGARSEALPTRCHHQRGAAHEHRNEQPSS